MMNHRSEEVPLTRQIEAVLIPSGEAAYLPEGLRVRVMQELGGTYTVMTENGHLARIEATDGDALGRAPLPKPTPADAPQTLSETLIWEQLSTCYDPEIPVNIVDLGLIYGCAVSDHEEGGKRVVVQMTLTAPGCGMGGVLKADIERKVSRLPEVKEAIVDVVLDPPWTPERMSEAARLQLGMM